MQDEKREEGEVMIVVSYGGGTDSTAELIEMQKRGIKPDLILFADTGGERPETYKYIDHFSKWLVKHDMPQITVVRNYGVNLELDCLIRRSLPALAYGFKTCSQRFKMDPQKKYINHNKQSLEVWAKGEKVIKAIGYEYGEERRAKISQDEKYKLWYPLIEWEIDREGCEKIITEAGLKQPGKSSCFFCPSMKKPEIFELKTQHPELLQRAFTIEGNAELLTVKGLGRSYSWRSLIESDENQIKMFADVCDVACECYDG